jgi:predicted small secreted protein
MDMRKYFFLAVILALSLLVSSCTTNPGAQNDTSSVASEPEQTGVFRKAHAVAA